jgi:glycosyltransferase involved in cell wall biosynthesis
MGQLRLGIDASNIREGGGLTHLIELLKTAEPTMHGICQVVVWGGESLLGSLPERTWLTSKTDPLLNQSLLSWIYWQKYRLPEVAKQNCDILFIPGGSYMASFQPYVTLSQNLLPFITQEYRRFGISRMYFKMTLLRFTQSASFRRANGMIFLNDFARAVVMEKVKRLKGEWAVIPHGINLAFRLAPRPAKMKANYSKESPFRLLYVSNVYPYKHHENVTKAVYELRRSGFWVEIDLLGPAYPPSLRRLKKTIQQVDPDEEFIHYHGEIPYSEIHKWYHHADGFVFASTCENLPNTLLEAMTAGLPIACSNRSPMPVNALASLIQDNVLRAQNAQKAYERAGNYSWEKCAQDTFRFIVKIANQYHRSI